MRKVDNDTKVIGRYNNTPVDQTPKVTPSCGTEHEEEGYKRDRLGVLYSWV